MNLDDYLKRLNYHGSLEPTLQSLQALHEAHLLAVPFENLDIHIGRKILLDEGALWEKIVEQRRGGFCYELNSTFAWLLRTLGFQVELLSAGVANEAGGFGPEFDHLTLLVHLEEENWLADVGFGESFRLPLQMQASFVQSQEWGKYRLERDEDGWILQVWGAGEWKPAYRFMLQAHELHDFAGMCEYHQTSPKSHFTQGRICSIATPVGRTTLSEFLLITKIHGERKERLLVNQEEYVGALAEQFGVVLPDQDEARTS